MVYDRVFWLFLYAYMVTRIQVSISNIFGRNLCESAGNILLRGFWETSQYGPIITLTQLLLTLALYTQWGNVSYLSEFFIPVGILIFQTIVLLRGLAVWLRAHACLQTFVYRPLRCNVLVAILYVTSMSVTPSVMLTICAKGNIQWIRLNRYFSSYENFKLR